MKNRETWATCPFCDEDMPRGNFRFCAFCGSIMGKCCAIGDECPECHKFTTAGDRVASGGREGICPECGEFRPDDDRVKAGMKCAECAGYATKPGCE